MTDPIRIKGSNVQVALSTPLTVLGIFVSILRERFSEQAHSDPVLKWEWQVNKKTTGIFIESGFNDELEARNVRPALWVDFTQHVFGRVSIGDRDQMAVYLPKRLENYHCLAEMDLVIDCTSKERGESILVGSIVQEFIHICSDIIQSVFGFRGMSPVIMGRPTLYEKDRSLWNTEIQFRVEYERRWRTIPFTGVWNGIKLKLADAGNPDLYYREMSLRE